MKIYHYHPETYQFICDGIADPDPLEEGRWLIPACATVEPPPKISNGQVAVMTSNGWGVYEQLTQEITNPQGNEERTPEQIQNEITIKTEKRLNDFAATRNYSVDSIAKYKDISDDEINTLPEQERLFVRKFRAECRYLALAVARTWAALNIGLDEVRNGLRPMPTGYADIEPLLPQLKWPDE